MKLGDLRVLRGGAILCTLGAMIQATNNARDNHGGFLARTVEE
jgi:hypothetical protein